ncbi:MAG: DUF3108 domain-containing protein [Alphaproteobacteria bacterium]
MSRTVPALSAIALALACGQATAAPGAVHYDYAIYVGGAQVAEFKVAIARDGAGYRIASGVDLVGLAAMMSDWTARSAAEGRMVDGRLVPDSYVSSSLFRGEDRTVDLAYADGAVIRVVAEPSTEEDERDAVTPEQSRGAVDPLTAFLQTALSPQDCGGDRRLFDGRRLSAMQVLGTEPAEAPETDYGIYAGPATLCTFTLNRIAGYSRRFETEQARNEDWAVWLADLGDGLAMPVRIEGETAWGMLRGHIVRYGPVAGE